MPIMSGYEATMKQRQREGILGLPRIPILAMTAQAMEGDKEACFQAGMDGYVSKPINVVNLFSEIRKLIGSSATQM